MSLTAPLNKNSAIPKCYHLFTVSILSSVHHLIKTLNIEILAPATVQKTVSMYSLFSNVSAIA